MFLPSGESTETVDVMQHLWTGHWPGARSPQMKSFSLAGKNARQNIHLAANQNYSAVVDAQSPTGDSLTYSWEIMEESGAQSVGGDFEQQPLRLSGLIQGTATTSAQIKAPAKAGAYRLFVYVIDRHQKAAYANIPFYVDEKTETMAAH
jgi:hypothetical protein